MIMQATQLQLNIIDKAINGTGNIVVSAAPGSGKTTTIKMVTDAILRKNPKANILAVSYTNTIKTTLTEKLDRRCHIFSLHQIGLSLLKAGGLAPKFKFAEHLHGKNGSPDNKYKKILTELVGKDFNLKEDGKIAFKIINESIELINKGRLELIDFSNYNELVRVANKYRLEVDGVHYNYIQMALAQGDIEYRQHGWTDFVDMIYLPILYNCKAKPGMYIGNKNDGWTAHAIDYVLVDEFQDSSPIIHSVLHQFSQSFNCRFIFVGDKMQSVFGFAAADVDSMDKARTKFNCEELPLNESFRCPVLAVEMINEIFGTNIVSKRGIDGSINHIQQSELMQYIQPGDMILARVNAPLMQTFLQLLQNGIPARLIKFDFKEFFEDLFDRLEKDNPKLWDDIYLNLHDYVWRRTQELRRKYSTYRANEMIEELQSNIDVLIAYLEFIKPTNRKGFFSKLEQLLDNANKGNYVSLLNVHIAKGLEAENVYILDYDKFPYVRDGMSEEDIQQERNIQFVALSRTLENLYLVNNDLD
jgi:DNA helicase-2/ATP-dependent DNA helicase PcrA